MRGGPLPQLVDDHALLGARGAHGVHDHDAQGSPRSAARACSHAFAGPATNARGRRAHICGSAVHDARSPPFPGSMCRSVGAVARRRQPVVPRCRFRDRAEAAPQEIDDQPASVRKVDPEVLLERGTVRGAAEWPPRLRRRPGSGADLLDGLSQERAAAPRAVPQLVHQLVDRAMARGRPRQRGHVRCLVGAIPGQDRPLPGRPRPAAPSKATNDEPAALTGGSGPNLFDRGCAVGGGTTTRTRFSVSATKPGSRGRTTPRHRTAMHAAPRIETAARSRSSHYEGVAREQGSGAGRAAKPRVARLMLDRGIRVTQPAGSAARRRTARDGALQSSSGTTGRCPPLR